ncbi:MAG: 5-amino-6-(D-ribitylamino)uracil--L-tyrosine 4-hydroxyphenyl transferase CofH, partial [Myxococcales bacterium]|nr:5-amino-6-(D-ribitylamino)uracil--L-tyrosine 4-hydroxyphenyl transferase CofH [Myxococcales bacterium]
MSEIERLLGACSPDVAEILHGVLSGGDLSTTEGVRLSAATGRDFAALCLAADEMRRAQVGDVVTYVINRNINFTNVCVKPCQFCAFSRDLRSEQGYFLPVEEIVRRAVEAWEVGATEICVQAGLAPKATGDTYPSILRAVKEVLPDIHIHAFSPEEVKYGAKLARVSVREYLKRLADAGLGSIPGTSAEVLSDSVRSRMAQGRISVAEWIEVIKTAHELGIPSTSTLMFGHIETAHERIAHLALLRDIQRDTGGFTEFVPLSFVHHEAPLFLKAKENGVQPGPTGNDVIRLYAIARLMLGADIPNLQASWVKEGIRQAQFLLDCGVNDLGGTLINESISTAAGAQHGQLMRPAELRRVIRD